MARPVTIHWKKIAGIVSVVVIVLFVGCPLMCKYEVWKKKQECRVFPYPDIVYSNSPMDETDSGSPESRVFRWDGNAWIQLHSFCAWTDSFECVSLKTDAGDTPIYIHDLQDDKYVSGDIYYQGVYEAESAKVIQDTLAEDRTLGFVDIGSHVGTFSIMAARAGHEVVAADPLVENVLRFCKSVQHGGLTKKVTIFFTAISNSYREVRFSRATGNIGGTGIVDSHHGSKVRFFNPDVTQTVRLDDLLPEARSKFQNAFLKMDVEGHEYQVLSSGEKFFSTLNVKAIYMEWRFYRKGSTGEKILEWMAKRNYVPFNPYRTKERYPTDTYSEWPDNVLWRKASSK